jgi:hypothetical protein
MWRCRLPKLHTVKLTVDDYDASLLLRPFSTMLYSLHSQLPSLADLTVTCQEGLRYSALPWRELGRATRLTRLAVEVSVLVFDAPAEQTPTMYVSAACMGVTSDPLWARVMTSRLQGSSGGGLEYAVLPCNSRPLHTVAAAGCFHSSF